MADITVNIDTPQLDAISRRLEPSARAGLHQAIAAEVQQTVRSHLRVYALAHHRTAARLGARPTGNLEGAGDGDGGASVSATSDSSGATVSIAAKGIRRALGPVTIRPRTKAALTIPVAAIAYGRSVAYLKNHGYDIFRPKGKNYLAYKENPKSQFSTVLYILAKQATLKHEPDLLPSRETLTANALEAARDYIMEGAAE